MSLISNLHFSGSSNFYFFCSLCVCMCECNLVSMYVASITPFRVKHHTKANISSSSSTTYRFESKRELIHKSTKKDFSSSFRRFFFVVSSFFLLTINFYYWIALCFTPFLVKFDRHWSLYLSTKKKVKGQSLNDYKLFAQQVVLGLEVQIY